MKKIIFIATFLLFFIYFGASAQTNNDTRTAKANVRQTAQRARITQGVKSGELTRKEAVGLRVQQKHIKRTKKRAKADGKVTRKEKREINRKQNRASRNIKRQKSDGQSRGN